MAVRQTTCRFCELEIENFSPYRVGQWRDRGNNTHCPERVGDWFHQPYRQGSPRVGLQALIRRALKSTRARGHRMTWAIEHGERTSVANGTCTRCGAEAQCNIRPLPNGIDIGGPAVATNCTK